MASRGRLVLVGTPLGNREDLSPRAREAIVSADLLLCEDTRSPLRLLGDGGALPPRHSCFVANEGKRVPLMLAHLDRGETVVFISEAGLPVWSDPGRTLVSAAVAQGHTVDVVPGPTAAGVAVCHSGFEASSVRFLGFLSREPASRRRALESLAHERGLAVLYEAGNRVVRLIADLAELLADGDDRGIVVARELTKRHQEVIRGTVAALASTLTEDLKGEVTVVIEGSRTAEPDVAIDAARATLEAFLADTKPGEKARALAKLTGLDARELYARLTAGGKPRT